MKLIKEFKEFAIRGNVVDLAVGVVIGGAFGTIITSLVNNILMPSIGYFISGEDLSKYKVILKSGQLGVNPATNKQEMIGEVAISYGIFIQSIINFLIIAFCVFLLVKVINSFRKKQEEETIIEETAGEKLLKEIRDILKEK